MTGPRLARSLETLRAQVNELAPHRSTASDGWIGDARHQAEASDHDPNAADVVTALDITHDPAHGCDCARLAASIIASQDPRVAYLIFDRRICDGTTKSGTGGGTIDPWEWRPYDGASPHTDHLHVSVSGQPRLYDNADRWHLDAADPHRLAPGDHGARVEALQRALQTHRLYAGRVDGAYGPATADAVNKVKRRHSWPVDGIAGRRVLAVLGLD